MTNKESQYSGDNFPKMLATRYTEEMIDPKRIKRIEMADTYITK